MRLYTLEINGIQAVAAECAAGQFVRLADLGFP